MNLSGVIVLILTTVTSIVIVQCSVIRDADCVVSIKFGGGDLREPQPLILHDVRNTTDFVHPVDEYGTLKVKIGEKILLACPGKDNYILGLKGPKNQNEIAANCVSDKTFKTATASYFQFGSLSCKYLPQHVARRTGDRCYGDAVHVEIGFDLRSKFFRTIEICRDDETMMTYWTKFHLTNNINGYQSGFPRPFKWQIGDFYGKYNIVNLYKASTQIETIEKLVGSRKLAEKYVNADANLYMARGHLTAKADFVYGSAQMSTFWYINAAPQWQTFNAGNWNSLESNVRQYAAKRSAELDVWTGTHGQMSLSDVNGKKVPIYLHVNATKRAFPVPKFYWKIIHDRVTKRATAFVGLNDPWADKIDREMFICNDIADKVKWLTWKSKDIVNGVSYACNVDDLRKSVPSIPSLDVKGLLV